MFASATQGGHNNVHLFSQRHMSLEVRCHGSVLVAWSVSTVKKVRKTDLKKADEKTDSRRDDVPDSGSRDCTAMSMKF